MSVKPIIKSGHPKPYILFVDDEPEELRSYVDLGLDDRARQEVLHPRDVKLENLEEADLVLVDYRIENWAERDSQLCIAMHPVTGMAVATVLREHVDRSHKDQLTAIAIHSARIDEVRGRLPLSTAQHVLASLNNLEWVFPKTEPRRYDQMVILAEAMMCLPRRWSDAEDDVLTKVISLLNMDQTSTSFDRCLREIQECQAPIHELRSQAHGLLFVRWLLHKVMPHPCFLWAEDWVAARLRIPVEEFRAIMNGDNQLEIDLEKIRYSGILADFLGKRWWRGALEDYVWEFTGGLTGDSQRMHDGLEELASRKLTKIDMNPPVVCLNEELQATGKFCSPSTAVRIRPDHWPAFADTAWMDIGTVEARPALKAMVDPLDQLRINVDDEE